MILIASLHLSILHLNLQITASIYRKTLQDLISVMHSRRLGASILMDKHLHDMQINTTNEKLHPNMKPGNRELSALRVFLSIFNDCMMNLFGSAPTNAAPLRSFSIISASRCPQVINNTQFHSHK